MMFKHQTSLRSEMKEDLIDNLPNYDYRDESFNFLINMNIERFLSPESTIIKTLVNKSYTIIISDDKSDIDQKSSSVKTLEVLVCFNKYQEMRSTIRFEFRNKFKIAISNKLRESNIQSDIDTEVEPPLNFFIICQKFLLIDSPYEIIICDFIKQNYSILHVKTEKRFLNAIFTFDELIKSPRKGIISIRNYIFGLNQNKALCYFIIEDNLFETIELYNDFKIILRKIQISNFNNIKDFKVTSIVNTDNEAK